MVVTAHHHCGTIDWSAAHFCRKLSGGFIYLYAVLERIRDKPPLMNTKKAPSSPYEAVLAITFGLLLIHYFFFPEEPRWLVGTMLFALLTLLSSTLAGWVALAWEKLTLGIGWFMSRVLFTIIFFVLLTPLALLQRMFKKDIFYKNSESSTYFIDRDHQYSGKDLENPW